MEIYDILTLLHSALERATPLMLAALGGLYSERSGVANIALEGMMLSGAFAAVLGSYLSGSALLGLLLAILAGALLALLHAFTSINLKADQIVSGAAINILSIGITGFLLFQIFGFHGSTPAVKKLIHWDFPSMEIIPIIGKPLRLVFLNHSPLFYTALLIAFLTWFLLFKTRLGLRLRATGENPSAALSLGIRISHIRYFAVIASGILAALGGAQLSLSDLSQFIEKMTAGRGFIALAALIFGKWNPRGVLVACFIFGLADALADYLQISNLALPTEVFLMIPFILTILILAGFMGGVKPPAALGKPFEN